MPEERLCRSWDRGSRISRPFAWNSLAHRLGSVLLALSLGGVTAPEYPTCVGAGWKGHFARALCREHFARNDECRKSERLAAPGFGFVAKPSADGWTHERDDAGNDVFRSSRMVVRVSPGNLPADKLPQPMPLDALNRQLREPYFGGGGGQGPYNDALLVTTADGKTLLHMRTWTMAPERADVAQQDIGAKGYSVIGNLRLALGRALLRAGSAAKGLDGPPRSRSPLLA